MRTVDEIRHAGRYLLKAMHQKLCQALLDSISRWQAQSIRTDGDVMHYMPVYQVGVPGAPAGTVPWF